MMMTDNEFFYEIICLFFIYFYSTCQVNFAGSALKVVRGSKQYIYDEQVQF